jgi:potassium efflux system protein
MNRKSLLLTRWLSPFLLILILLLCSETPCWAKSKLSTIASELNEFDVSKESLKLKIAALNTRQGIDETAKSKVLSIYQAAEDNLNNIERFNAQAISFKSAISKAPVETKKLQKDIEQALSKVGKQKIEDFNSIPTAELEQRFIIEKSKISTLDEELKKLESELSTQNTRPQLIREELLSAQQELESTQKKLQLPIGKPDAKLDTEAQQLLLKTLVQARSAEIKMLEVEAVSNPARVDRLKVQVQLVDLQKNALLQIATEIENVLSVRRQQEAKEMQDALSQAEKELSGKHSLIQKTTRENIEYSGYLQTITAKIEQYSDQKTKIEAQAGTIEADFKSAEKKISLAGLSPALGKILREQRRDLSTQAELELQSQTIQNETALTSLEQFKVEDALDQLQDIDATLKNLMQEVDDNLPVEQRMMVQAELRVLLNNKKELLNKLLVADTTYLRILGDFDFARQQMATQAQKFAAYLDERLLWVPSSEPINTDFISGLYRSTKWLLSPINWMTAVADILKLSIKHPFLVFLGLISLASLQLCKKWAKQQLAEIPVKVEKIYTDSFSYTVKALAYSLILVLPLPLLIAGLGWFLSHNIEVDDFSKSLGAGLRGAATPLFFIQFFYQLFAPKGITRTHFQWQKANASLARQQIAWLRFVIVPTAFLINSTGASAQTIYSDNLGRLALIISMLAMAWFMARMLNPTTGLLSSFIAARPNSWVARLRFVWYAVACCTPLVIIGFAVAGYYLIITIRMIILTMIVHEMVFRWLTLVNRQLAIKNARQKRKTAVLADKQTLAPGGEDPVLPIDEQQIDIPKINAQTIKLLNVFIGFSLIIGFWVIWKNILPAFSFLERIVLWQHLVNIEGQESYQPVTLINLLLAGLYSFIIVVSVRNLSGVMELLIFSRLSIEAGSRYAANQLSKYLLVAIGFVSVANELGGSWSQVQWLVAALSVGLGFGLQEIFANMVSGIILLFERPIRVGDTVTIGTVTGKVSRIQMRATTLIDMDQKDLIVPNKTFITSQLTNWSLTDAVTRIVIPVGIAYGSDVELAHKVMLDTVRSTPLVLTEPEPSVLFIEFGESSLNFSIRVFVSELGNRLPVTHALHVRLEQALREHKITIPFPHRDVNLRREHREVELTGDEYKQALE